MRKNIFLISIVAGSLLLLAFVAPQAINKAAQKLHIPNVNVSARPFHLGLDLLGGTHLVYQADLSKVAGSATDAMQGVRDVVERRVNLFGVSEPVVQISGKDRLIVDLAGVTDVNQAIQLIGQTPFLEFKIQLPNAQGDAVIKQALGPKANGITAGLLCTPGNIASLTHFFLAFLAHTYSQPPPL